MKLRMTVDDALNYADTWSHGHTFHEGSEGWRVVCLILAEEVRRLREQKTDKESDDKMIESHSAMILLDDMVEFIVDLQECVNDWDFPILTEDRIQSLLKRYYELQSEDVK